MTSPSSAAVDVKVEEADLTVVADSLSNTASVDVKPIADFTAADNAVEPGNDAAAQQDLQSSSRITSEPDITPERISPISHLGGPELLPSHGYSDMNHGLPMMDLDPQQNNNSAIAFAPNATASSTAHVPTSIGEMFPLFDPTFNLPMEGLAPPQPTLEESEDVREAQPAGLKAFAKLQFPDGIFYVNTTSLILGRDVDAAKRALRREAELKKMQHGYHTPGRRRRQDSKYSRSVVSESGGIMRRGGDDDSDSNKRSEGKRKKSESAGSSGQRRDSLLPAPDAMIEYKPQIDPNARMYAPNSDAAIPVDPERLRPSSTVKPVVGIHPSGDHPASAYKALSRHHVELNYNHRQTYWELLVLGRNGCFVDDVYYYRGDVVPLNSGSNITIGSVTFDFILPDNVADIQGTSDDDFEDRWQRDANEGWISPGGTRLSTNFEGRSDYFEGLRNEETSGDSEMEPQPQSIRHPRERHRHGRRANEASENTMLAAEGESNDDSEEDDEQGSDDEGSDEDADLGDLGEEDLDEGGQEEREVEDDDEEEALQAAPPPPKRKGPGRPPKDGEMSKRERKELLQRQAEEKARKAGPQPVVPKKNKVGRPRKHPLPEAQPVKTEKRKYTKRKPKDPNAPKPEGSNDDDEKASKKDKKPPRAARSPSPVFDMATITEEQLAKPTQNYVELIAEVLSERPDGKMSLPQIYRAITRKHPYFSLKVTTTGWQSSVRHNLSQHEAFKKVEKDGKGWMWALVPGIPIGKEKKQRQRTPTLQGPMYPQAIFANPHHGMVPPQPGMMGPPPGYPNNVQMQPHLMQGQHPQYRPQLPGYGMHPPHPSHSPQPPVNGQHPVYQGAPPPAQIPGSSGTPYRSPYEPKAVANTASPSSYRPQQQGPAAPPMQQHAARPNPQPQGPPVLNQQVHGAIERFKEQILGGLKAPNAQAVMASAVNRALGLSIHSVIGGPDPMEDKLVMGLRKVISGVPGGAEVLKAAEQRASQPPVHPARTQQPAATQPYAPTPGTSRPNGVPISIPRPSMTHSMARTNSGTPSNRPESSSASPAPPLTTPAIANAGSGPSQLGITTSSSAPDGTVATPTTTAVAGDAPSPLEAKNAIGKRQRSEEDDAGKENGFKAPRLEDADDVGEQDFKPLQTSATPGLRV